jgi:hypothetical protein
MFAVLHSDINSLKSGLLHLTDQPYCKKGRSAKVKDGIINLFLRNYLVDQYSALMLSFIILSVAMPGIVMLIVKASLDTVLH